MQPLIIGPEQMEAIQAIINHAEDHPIDLPALQKILAGGRLPVGDRQGYCCWLPSGYRVVYSIEEQPRGWMRHLSVSVEGGGWPSTQATEMIMGAFGFRCQKINDPELSLYAERKVKAVNVLETLRHPEAH